MNTATLLVHMTPSLVVLLDAEPEATLIDYLEDHLGSSSAS